MQQDTICAIATAQGGAIGVIRVSGPEAIEITSRIFTPMGGKPLNERQPYTLTFGKIYSAEGEIIDEVLVSVFRAPTPTPAKILQKSLAMAPHTFFNK